MKINFRKLSNTIAKAVPHVFTAAGILWFGIGAVAAFNLGVHTTVNANTTDDDELLGKQFIKDVLPVAGAFAIGTACVIMSDACNTRMLRAANKAYTNAVKNYQEYKAAVVGALGAEANKLAMKKATDEHKPDISEDEPPLPVGAFHFYDEFSRNDFVAELSDVIAAEYEFNRLFQAYGVVSINQFYDLLNAPRIEHGNEKQFDCGEIADWCGYVWIDFQNVEHVEEDGSKWYSIHINPYPTIDGIINWDDVVNDEKVNKVVGAIFNH